MYTHELHSERLLYNKHAVHIMAMGTKAFLLELHYVSKTEETDVMACQGCNKNISLRSHGTPWHFL